MSGGRGCSDSEAPLGQRSSSLVRGAGLPENTQKVAERKERDRRPQRQMSSPPASHLMEQGQDTAVDTYKVHLTLRTLECFFLKILFLKGGEGRETERERETSVCGCLSHIPYWGPGHPTCAPLGSSLKEGMPLPSSNQSIFHPSCSPTWKHEPFLNTKCIKLPR